MDENLLQCSVIWEQKWLLKWKKISNRISHVLHQLSEAIALVLCTVKLSSQYGTELLSFCTAEHREGEYSPKLLDLIALIFMNDSLLYSQDTKENHSFSCRNVFVETSREAAKMLNHFKVKSPASFFTSSSQRPPDLGL